MVELGAVQHPSHYSCELEILKVIGIVHHIISGNQLVVNISDRLVGEVLILIVLLWVYASTFLVIVPLILTTDAACSHADDSWASH